MLAVLCICFSGIRLPSRPVPHYFSNEHTDTVLPLAGAEYPDAFKGVIWMDQGGHYAYSDIPVPAPDLAVSFGDSHWDAANNKLTLDVAGPGWIWVNSGLGHLFWTILQHVGYHYTFSPSSDFSVIQIYPTLDLGFLGTWSAPEWFMSFTMEKQTPPAGACPPAPNATKKEIAKCATWDRVSSTWMSPLLGKYGYLHYYVFQIVDAEGNRIEPYWSIYKEYADSTCSPNSLLQFMVGTSAEVGEHVDKASHCPTVFRGRESVAAAGYSISGAKLAGKAEL